MTASHKTILSMAQELAGMQRTLVFPPDALARLDAGRVIARELIVGLQAAGSHPDLLACHFMIMSGETDHQVKRGYMRELAVALARPA